MSDEDIRRRLEDAGRAPAPAPDARFADDLEVRLRARMATEARGAPRPGWAGVPRLPAAAAAALAAVVLVAALAAGLLVDRQPVAVTLVSAVDTQVVQPDGEVVAGRPGLELRDGAVVRTGPEGRALVGDVDLGPGTTALIVDGSVRRLSARAGTERTTTTAPAVTLPPTTVTPTVPALPSTTTTTTAPPDRTTETAPPSSGEEPSGRLELFARMSADGQVGLAWTVYEGPDFYAYIVLRADAPAEPAYPPHETDRIIYVVRERDATRAFDRAASHAEPVYRVVAVDRDGRELARSDAVSPMSGR